MASQTAKRVLEIAKSAGPIRPCDLDRYGIARKYLNLLFHKGLLDRVDRGPGWTERLIPLSEFGGNLSNVQSMTIGVGNPNNGGSGSGPIFIDDIGFGRPAPVE